MKRNDKVLLTNGSGRQAIGRVSILHRDGTATVEVVTDPEGTRKIGYGQLHVDGTATASPWYKPVVHFQTWKPVADETEESVAAVNKALSDAMMAEYRQGVQTREREANAKIKAEGARFISTMVQSEIVAGPMVMTTFAGQIEEGEWGVVIIRGTSFERSSRTGMIRAQIRGYANTTKTGTGRGAVYETGSGDTEEEALLIAIIKAALNIM